MKKFFAFVLVCCLVFSSSSIAFAAATQWDTSDSQHLTGIYNSLVSTTANGVLKAVLQIESDLATYMPLKSDVKTISNTLGQIWSALSFAIDGQYISVFVARIMTAVEGLDVDLTSIVSKLTSINTQTTNTAANTAGIYSLINGYDNIIIDNLPILNDLKLALYNYRYGAVGANSFTDEILRKNSHYQLYSNASNRGYGYYNLMRLTDALSLQTGGIQWQYGSPIGNLAVILQSINDNAAYTGYRSLFGFNESQTFTNWNGSTLSTSIFKPSSAIHGIYNWLSDIQTPLARLAFVHASDEEIAARQKAEANQTAVVDNFIDSSGSGSANPSDFNSVSDLSSGFKDNIVTDASVSGIWHIFNDDNFGWFSQETANQLDTSASASRSLRNSGSYPTPLLDQQTEDIMRILGGNDND